MVEMGRREAQNAPADMRGAGQQGAREDGACAEMGSRGLKGGLGDAGCMGPQGAQGDAGCVETQGAKLNQAAPVDTTIRDTKLIIDLGRLADNLAQIRAMVGPDVAVTAVVKANGYGHGAAAIAPTLVEGGVRYLAVATLSEALELKAADPSYPVFIMGHTPDRLLPYVVEHDITQTIWTLRQAQILSRLAQARGCAARVHLKVDTGFHRLGQPPTEAYADEIRAMSLLPALDIEGIFSHLALAGEAENQSQYKQFTDFIDALEGAGCHFRYQHIADSIACVDYPQYRMNMVRPGALLYGMHGAHIHDLPVRQVLTFTTAISQLRDVPQGEGLSYDYAWKAPRDSRIATLPFGYADGYPRNMRDKGYVVIGGVRCPLVGVLCMDQCMADVTDVPDVCEGMEAVIYGDGADGSMTIAEAASLAGTNKNEILARFTARPVRVYTR